MWMTFLISLNYLAAAFVVLRVLTRSRMEPSVRLAWNMVIEVLPVVGIIAYFLFGEVRVALVGEHARGHERVEHEPHRPLRADRLDAFHTTHVTRGFRHSGRLRTRAIGPRRPPLRP